MQFSLQILGTDLFDIFFTLKSPLAVPADEVVMNTGLETEIDYDVDPGEIARARGFGFR